MCSCYNEYLYFAGHVHGLAPILAVAVPTVGLGQEAEIVATVEVEAGVGAGAVPVPGQGRGQGVNLTRHKNAVFWHLRSSNSVANSTFEESLLKRLISKEEIWAF